ncbi:hypothetical protein N665_1138s0018 [Sinapis alba]|nr:hypothetical protein N665_1138s0018 [Sinapis alba]
MVNLNDIMVSFVILVVASTFIPSLAIDKNEPKKCALHIISQVFGNGVASIPCCQELVQEGKECHDTVVKYIADRPSLIRNEPKYLQKRDDVWAYCVSVSKASSPP